MKDIEVGGELYGFRIGDAILGVGWSWQQWAIGVIFDGPATVFMFGPATLIFGRAA